MAQGTRKAHTRRTPSGGTTTVHQHNFRYRAASTAASLWDRPGQRGKAVRYLAVAGIASVAYAIVAAIWGIGEGIVTASITIIAVSLADNWHQARRAYRKAPKYQGLSARLNNRRQRFYLWRAQHMKNHPAQAALFESHVRRYKVTASAPGANGKPAARAEKIVRGKRKARRLEARAKAYGWNHEETLTVLDPMEKVRAK
jgi:hypothetical protein